MPEQTKRVLYVEDDVLVRNAVVRQLVRRMPHLVIDTASSREEALTKLDSSLAWSWLLIDLCLGPYLVGPDRNTDGLTVVLEARRRHIWAPAIILSGVQDLACAINPKALRIVGVLAKPIKIEDLLDLLRGECDAVTTTTTTTTPPASALTLAEIKREAAERELDEVKRVLAWTRGSKHAAAKYLQVDRRTVQRKVQLLQEAARKR